MNNYIAIMVCCIVIVVLCAIILNTQYPPRPKLERWGEELAGLEARLETMSQYCKAGTDGYVSYSDMRERIDISTRIAELRYNIKLEQQKEIASKQHHIEPFD